MVLECVYRIRNLENGKLYVGSTLDFKRRVGQHLSRLRAGKHHSAHLQNAWRKYGAERFVFEVVEEVGGPFLEVREQFWIDKEQATKRRFGYNKCSTAARGLGSPHTDSSKLAMSKARKGRRSPAQQEQWERVLKSNVGRKRPAHVVAKIAFSNTGKVRSEACRKLLSVLNKGRKHTAAARAKIAAAGRGRVVPSAVRAKIAAAQRGVPKGHGQSVSAATKGRYLGACRYNAKGVVQLSLRGDVLGYFEAGAVAARAVGCQNTLITRVVKGSLRQTGGFVWRRVAQLSPEQVAGLSRLRTAEGSRESD